MRVWAQRSTRTGRGEHGASAVFCRSFAVVANLPLFLLQQRTGGAPAQTRAILVQLGLIVLLAAVLIAVGLIVYTLVHRRMGPSSKATAFTLMDLRQMKAEGTLSDAEFQRVKSLISAKERSQLNAEQADAPLTDADGGGATADSDKPAGG